MQLKNTSLDKNPYYQEGFGAFSLGKELERLPEKWKIPKGFEINTIIKIKEQESWQKGRKLGEAEGREKGQAELKKRLKQEIIKDFNEYFSLVTHISDYVQRLTKETIKDNFNIKEIRTRFDFLHKNINLLFIINTKPELEPNFANIILSVKKQILSEKNYIASISYLNVLTAELDNSLINYDYPAIRVKEKNGG